MLVNRRRWHWLLYQSWWHSRRVLVPERLLRTHQCCWIVIQIQELWHLAQWLGRCIQRPRNRSRWIWPRCRAPLRWRPRRWLAGQRHTIPRRRPMQNFPVLRRYRQLQRNQSLQRRHHFLWHRSWSQLQLNSLRRPSQALQLQERHCLLHWNWHQVPSIGCRLLERMDQRQSI